MWVEIKSMMAEACKQQKEKHDNNNKPPVEEDERNANRFSQLREMVGNMADTTKILSEAVKNKNNNDKKIKNKKNNNKEFCACYADSVKMSQLDGTIESHVKSNKKEQGSSENVKKKTQKNMLKVLAIEFKTKKMKKKVKSSRARRIVSAMEYQIQMKEALEAILTNGANVK